MKQYLNDLAIMFGMWKDFKTVIEKANPNLEQDFNSILKAIPSEYIPDFLQWMLDIGNMNLVKVNIDAIMESMINYKQYTTIWIEKTLILLSDINDPNIDESLSSNFIQIIKGPYQRGQRGTPWVIFDLCQRCRDMATIGEKIEQNYEEILQAVFCGNQFLSNNKKMLYKIKELISKIAEQKGVGLRDIEHIGSGQYSECLKIGDTVLKIGKKRILEEIPVHKRILKAIFRGNIPNNYEEEIEKGNLEKDDVIGLECQDLVDTDWYEGLSDEEVEKNLYMIYRELRESGIIWTDVKPENIGRLIKPNVVEYTTQDSNGEKIKQKITLPIGELVIFDTDRIYTKERLPKFDNDEGLYKKFEERFCLEESERL